MDRYSNEYATTQIHIPAIQEISLLTVLTTGTVCPTLKTQSAFVA